MRIIIVGGGEIGYALARELSRDHSLSVVDLDPEVGKRFSALDVAFLAGSGTSADVLGRAGVDGAGLLIACTGLDEVNMVACAVATGLGARRTICFASREDFAGGDSNAETVRKHFGIERIIWPEAQLAAEIERIIAAPGAIDAEVFADGRIRLLEFRLEAHSPLTAAPLAALHLPHGALIVAVKHSDSIEIPRGETQLRHGDKVFVMGTPEAVAQVTPQIQGTSPDRARQMVTIIGGGDVGFRLAQRLEASRDVDVRIIESDRDRGEMLAGALRRALVLNGDGTDLELLESEEIGRSDVLVSVIDNDERNLFASLLGRQLGVRRIITRVSRPANLRLFERVGIDVALSARGAAVSSLVHQIQGGHAHLLAVLEEGQATIVEIAVPAGFRPQALMHMKSPPQSIVGAILRGPDVIIPRGADEIHPGDRLIVFAAAQSVKLVRDYFGSV
ncbi:MAG TPA: Trk system potassium transporter TrkA [Vicinamibacterales bacterium]|nr:Trk system potassium transporter TrkA [Vicinamibacterales bacterium]